MSDNIYNKEESCSYRLPCGICRLTNMQCPKRNLYSWPCSNGRIRWNHLIPKEQGKHETNDKNGTGRNLEAFQESINNVRKANDKKEKNEKVIEILEIAKEENQVICHIP